MRVAGRIAYMREGRETGRERFERYVHGPGGLQTLRAFCEMDDFALTRDVSYLLDSTFRPINAFCRVIAAGEVKGTTLFLLDGDAVECEGRTLTEGRVSQRIVAPGAADYLGLHPLVGDALVAVARGTSRIGEFLPVPGATNSISPNGDEGLLAQPVTIDAAYLGEEEVTVPAGTFQARRYALRWSPQWPPADLWVSGDEALFVRLSWDMVGAVYELVELTIEP